MELVGDVAQVIHLGSVLRVAVDVPTVQLVLPDVAIWRALHFAYYIVTSVLNVQVVYPLQTYTAKSSFKGINSCCMAQNRNYTMLRFFSRFQADFQLKSVWFEPLLVGGYAPFSLG